MALTTHYVASDGADTWANSTSSSTPCSWATMIANATAGDVCMIKAGTYDRTTTSDTLGAGVGTVTDPVIIQGCDSSWNAIAPTRTNVNGPLIDTNYPVIAYTTARMTTRVFYILRSLKISAAYVASASGTVNLATNSSAVGCIITSSGNHANSRAVHGSAGGYLIDCDCSTSGASAVVVVYHGDSGSLQWVEDCRITTTSTAASGIVCAGTSSVNVLLNNTIYATSAHAISITTTTGRCVVKGNTCVDASGSSSGVYFADGATGLNLVEGNQLTDNGAYGIEAFDGDIAILAIKNRLTRNTSGAVSGATDWLAATSYGHVTTAQAGADAATQRAAEYVSPGSANYDYRLKPASYAIAAGMPPFADCGACQSSISIPAAADVQSGAADYGYAGALLDPAYATTAATNAAHQAADVVNLNAHKDEMIAANTAIKAHYPGVEDGTAAGGAGIILRPPVMFGV